MKIDRAKLKKHSSEVPPDCKQLIDRLKACSIQNLSDELSNLKSWSCGKCELYHWIDVLNMFDQILEKSCLKRRENQWCLPCDDPAHDTDKDLLLKILYFTAMVIENSFHRNFYNSMEHLITLLSSNDMHVVLAVLNLLYVFSKRSNFITRLNSDKRQSLLFRLLYLAETWGGKENGFGLAECCQNLPPGAFPASASTLHFEYYAETNEKKSKNSRNAIIAIHIDNLDKITDKTPSQLMEELIEKYNVPESKRMQLFTHVRLAHGFSDYHTRLLCVQARLQALSVLVYDAVPVNVNSLLYNGFIEELVDILDLQDPHLIDIKAAALRTMASIIHLEGSPKLNTIIDATGAGSYHGFLPVLLRNCIKSLTEPGVEPYPLPFATALLSFLYHLASYESGTEAVLSSGAMEALLKIINWNSNEQENLTLATRAVRVIDLLTNMDMQGFQTHGGLTSFIQRLEMEVNICRVQQPYVCTPVLNTMAESDVSESDSSVMFDAIEDIATESSKSSNIENLQDAIVEETNSVIEIQSYSNQVEGSITQCAPKRNALLKSMLNFIRKTVQDVAFSDTIRHIMDGSLPQSLKHIISNAEYYGSAVFLLAIDFVTVYIFQEPSMLPSLQDNGLADVVLHALLVKEVPATREVLASLPNVFSAICLNERGLQSFVRHKPFEKLFRVLISPEYLPAFRICRKTDRTDDAASNLGNAMDELMRHQPSLRTDAIAAVIKLLEELCVMGRETRFVCSTPSVEQGNVSTSVIRLPAVMNEAGSSDEEEEEEETAVAPAQVPIPEVQSDKTSPEASVAGSKTSVPLVDYIPNVMRFLKGILCKNSTDDHCKEFVKQKGLVPLMAILGLPNLPIDFPVIPSCQSVIDVCCLILDLAREPQVLKQGLLQLNEVLQNLEHLHRAMEVPGRSVLIEELINAPSTSEATLNAQSTPSLHYMTAAHAYIIMFMDLFRAVHSDMRTISISHWGSELGLGVLKGLSSLYTSLIWEITVLLAFYSNENSLSDDNFQLGRQQLEKLLRKPETDGSSSFAVTDVDLTSSSAMCIDEEDESSNGNSADEDKLKLKDYNTQIKQLQPLLSAAPRLGRAIEELFSVIVKLCIGPPTRQRHAQRIPPSPSIPSPTACAVATALTRLLTVGITWEPPPSTPVSKFRLTFYIFSVGFTSSMLFDELKYPYHLMLEKYLACGGLDAFFSMFHMALTCGREVGIEDGLEHPEIPDRIEEFLQGWLALLENMVNPKNVLESPHVVLTKPNSVKATFNPLHYLIHIHKRAFESITYLWSRKPLFMYGERIAELMLAVICHILKGETLFQEKLQAESSKSAAATDTVATSAATATTTTTTPSTNRGSTQNIMDSEDSGVNADHLTQLTDMGFSRAVATLALRMTNSLEEATDFVLAYPVSLRRSSAMDPAPDTANTDTAMDWEMSEEDQMLRAIAMSLGENVLVSTNQATGEQSKVEEEPKKTEFILSLEDPIPVEDFDGFTENILDGCLKMIDSLPDTVYRCCDLLVTVSARNGQEWQNEVLLTDLINDLQPRMLFLLKYMTPMKIPFDKKGWGIGVELPWIPTAKQFAVRVHLLTLLFEKMKYPCGNILDKMDMIIFFIKVVEVTSNCMTTLQDEPAPKWLSYILLLLDQYEKVALCLERKAQMLTHKRQWKWFDDRSTKWNSYPASTNKLIDDAYKSGENSVRFTARRRNYLVRLNSMMQINEETGNGSPIMLTVEPKDDKDKSKNQPKPQEEVVDVDLSETPDVGAILTVESQPAEIFVLKGLNDVSYRQLISYCVMLLKVPLEPDTLQAVIRLCLRLTRKYGNAALFSKLDGPKALLALTQRSKFCGFTTLASLLFRHVLEDPVTLTHTMEKVIRSASMKEVHHVFRELGPAACRDPKVFQNVAVKVLRLDALPVSKIDEEEGRASMQILKCIPAKANLSQSEYYPDIQVAPDCLKHLLTSLIKCSKSSDEDASPEETSPVPKASSSETASVDDDNDVVMVPLHRCENVRVAELTAPRSSRWNKDSSKNNKAEPVVSENDPIFGKTEICRLLTELVQAYPHCAKFITDYSFYAGETELVSEDCTALAFILDNLLYNNKAAGGDKETPTRVKRFIVGMASSNHSPDIQETLVNEIKHALLRALSLPESADKHARVQAVTGLINTIVETNAIHPTQNILGISTRASAMKVTVRNMIKKGILIDLARIPHYLDLSSPHMATTVNCALKPLETLSRIANLPHDKDSNKTENKYSRVGGRVSSYNPQVINEENDILFNVLNLEPISSDSDSNSESAHSDNETDRNEQAEDAEEDEDTDASQLSSEVLDNTADDTSNYEFFQLPDQDIAFFHMDEVFPVSNQSIPPAPSTIAAVHPLLVRPEDSQGSLVSRTRQTPREHRTNMDGLAYRVFASAGGSNNSLRHPNASCVYVQSSQPSTSTMQSRVLRANAFTDLRNALYTEVFSELYDIPVQNGNISERSSSCSLIPSTAVRWKEECKILDGDSMHDCVAGLKIVLLKTLEASRDETLKEKKEKRKKMQDKSSESSTDTIVLSDTDRLEEITPPEQRADCREITMEVAEPATQFESNISATSTPIVLEQEEAPASAGIDIPEEVDPSFLAALPDNIRQEVVSELQRLRQRATPAVTNENNTEEANVFTEVNPEFLAALPPDIQEEILAEQRAEQQRLAAQNSNPDVPVDPTSFIQTLPPSLRIQVLADMDDSLLALLPADLATEAHTLRRERENRRRQIQDRLFSSRICTTLSRIMRSSGRGGARYTVRSIPQRGQNSWNILSRDYPSISSSSMPSSSTLPNSMKMKGRFLLDNEALACLLVLLFVEEPRLNLGRFYRVLRNLCYHVPTRNWIIKSLLSILERTKDQVDSPPESRRHKKTSKNSSPNDTPGRKDVSRPGQPSWLSIGLDAALGCRPNIFQIRPLATAHRRANEHNTLPSTPLVTIHPLASPVICRHVLDTLISLAKCFPIHFLPETAAEAEKSKDLKEPKKHSDKSSSKSDKLSRCDSDFWDVLMKLDSLSTTSRKGKSVAKHLNSGSVLQAGSESDDARTVFQVSPLAQLIALLAHPVVKRSASLTDRLLRLLSLISLASQEVKPASEMWPLSQILSGELSTIEVPSLFSSNNTPQSVNDKRKTRQDTKAQAAAAASNSDEEAILDHHLKLAVEVLTSKTCSEEGLEDATSLLLMLSRRSLKARHTVLYLLLDGARELGQSVCINIQALMTELRNLNPSLISEKTSDSEDKDMNPDEAQHSKGLIQDRFTNTTVVVTAPTKIKGRGGRELQLPSMSSLTSKASSQAFFLRILKVIIQLVTSSQQTQKNTGSNRNELTDPRLRSSDINLSSFQEISRPRQAAQGNLFDLDLSSTAGSSDQAAENNELITLHLSSELMLDDLWIALSDCLKGLAETPDQHAVLVLQPAVEAFFLVHALPEKKKKEGNQKDTQENDVSHLQDVALESLLRSSISDSSTANMSVDSIKFLKFAETHRTVLNQILRQSTTPLADGPFSVLVDHTRVLDFDVKRRYFRQELERLEVGFRRGDLEIHVKREHVFEDSFRELHRRTPEEWKSQFYIVFEGEEGQDAGGLLREWYTIISREIFNPMYALFITSPGDRVTYMINSSSHCNSNHLNYFKFVGRLTAKAIYDNKLLESYFTRSFYKHILGKNVKYTDMESEDYSFYQGLVFLLEHGVNELGYDLTFSVEVQEFGVTEVRDLKPNGRNVFVSEESKHEYVKLVCQEKMTGAIRTQLKAFLEGFYEIIPKRLISIFNEQELELLISGLPNIDVDDLKANTEYHKYQPTSLQIVWFWRALRSFDQADRANFLQFVTGTSKVPLQGFAALEGMNGTQKFQIHRDDRSADRLPSAHTCFNQLDLPAYETYDKLRSMLLKAIHECSEGFGFA